MFEFHSSNELKGKRVKLGDWNEIQPQEILIDKLTRKWMDRDGINERKLEVPLSRGSFRFLIFCSTLALSILLLRSFQLQVIQGEEYTARAERNRFAYMSIENTRGIIYDRNMDQLVYNRSRFSLVFEKSDSDDWMSEAKIVSRALGIEYYELVNKISESDSERVVIARDIPREELIILEVQTRNLSSFRIEREIARHYAEAEIFSHIIGYTGRISPDDKELTEGGYSRDAFIGRAGLERSYESDLKMRPGQIKMRRDARGVIHSEEVVSMGESGNDLVLWVDAGLQRKLHQELGRVIGEIGSEVGSAVAIDPRTGGILALVNYPGFNNNAFSDGVGLDEIFQDPRNLLFNRIISGTYSVGSIIKPLIGLAALEEGTISASKEFYSAGRLVLPNPWNPSQPSIFADLAPRGWYNLRRAIAFSSNVFFYIIGGGYENQVGLGPTIIKRYLNLFGWGSPTGVDIPGEKAGFIPDPEWKRQTLNDRWRVGDSFNLSIGQGRMSATPLQVASAFVAVANGGRLLQPMLVRDVLDKEGNIIRSNNTRVLNAQFVGSENMEIIREGMRGAVDYGSARFLSGLPVSAGAKTGTAQIPRVGYYNNWITVFAPYDEPEIVLTILIEEVQGVRAATLPVAKEVLEWYFRERWEN